jgi:hypothetical protein
LTFSPNWFSLNEKGKESCITSRKLRRRHKEHQKE